MKNHSYENNKKSMILIILISGIIILLSSIEALMISKSQELLKLYLEVNHSNTAQDFLSYVLLSFFINIFEPVLISLYSFFTYEKYGFSNVFKFVFCGILLIRIILIVTRFEIYSIFYYLILMAYVLLFIVIAHLPTKKRKD